MLRAWDNWLHWLGLAREHRARLTESGRSRHRLRRRWGLSFELLEARQMLAFVPELVADLYIPLGTNAGSNPVNLTNVSGTLYFGLGDSSIDRELWKTDGTSSGTVLVKDIFPGSNRSDPSFLTNVNGILFFQATIGAAPAERELWKSDGTSSGTILVKDINPGTSDSQPQLLTNVNGTLYFVATTNIEGRELWKSDGTSSGTVLVKDINPGVSNSSPSGLTIINDTLFFSARGSGNDSELWKSDGTSSGTVLVKDIIPGMTGSYPGDMARVNDTLYFTARSGGNDFELWKSDGTSSGTIMVKDINPGSSGSYPRFLTNINGTLLFGANNGVSGLELWKSDGTSSGTVLVKDIFPGSSDSLDIAFSNVTDVSSTLFFRARNSGAEYELWKSDGTSSGTVLVRDIRPNGGADPQFLTNVNGKLFFTANDNLFGNNRELWVTNGSSSGTFLVAELNPSTSSGSDPRFLTNANGTLYFSADAIGVGRELWKLEETPWVSLAIAGSPLGENSGGAMVTATLDITANEDVIVTLSFGGTATNNADYSASSTSILIPAGSLTGAITLTGINDTTFESNESVIIDIVSVDNGVEAGTQQLIATIQDDDNQPSVTLNLTGSPLSENAGIAIVTAILSNLSTQNVTVNLTFSGTAVNNTDYSASSASILIPAGSLTGAITLTGINGTTFEANESVIIDIHSVNNGTESGTQQVIATINDDDNQPSVTLNLTGSPLFENAGIAIVTATLSNPSAQNVTVNLTFSGTAANNTDYSASSASILIPAGSLTGAITLTGINDTTFEANESVIVDINSVNNGTESGTQQVIATINDDDNQPSVTLNLTGSPLSENAGIAIVTATLSNPSTQNVTVQLGFTGDALDGVDYSANSTSIVILAGQTSGAITLTSMNDDIDELNEEIIADITGVTNGVESGTQQVTATINDDDLAPSVQWTLADTTVAENVGSVSLIVTLSGPSSQLITVPFSLSGTATSGSDYTLAVSPIAIPAGATSASITLTVIDDVTSEGTETVVVTLDTPILATLGSITSRTTQITDNDAPPTIQLTASSFTLAENGGSIMLVALLSTVLDQDVTVDLGFSGSALSNIDYSASAASIVIATGQTSGSITITSRNDVLAEGNETLVVDITGVAGAVESGTQQVVITLVDDSNDPFVVAGSQLTIVGTPNDDSLILQFTSTTDFIAQLSNASMGFSLSQINAISFNGQAGNDTLLFFGSNNAETATLATSGATVGGSGYSFNATNLEYKYLFGSASDTATFSDSASADQLYQLPAYSLMLDSTVSYYNQVIGFGSVIANTTTGADILLVYGTGGNDTYTASTTNSTLTSAGLSLVGNGFDQVFAFGSGGNDTASFTGSSGDEVFYGLGGYGYSVVNNAVFLQYLISFSQTTVTAGSGSDAAIFFDAAGNDTFTANPNTATMSGAGFSDSANGFDQVFAFATGGGNDVANLDGSNQDDIFSGNAQYAALFRTGVYLLQVYNFELVTAILSSNSGNDVAELIDGFGNDVLNASGATAELTYSTGNRIKLAAFDTVYAKNQNGGNNTKQVINPLAYQLVFEGTWA